MSRWFRFHTDAIRNPKVARLNDAQYRLWTELMCVAGDNDGGIPCLDDLKHILKRRLDHLSRGLKDLISVGLIDPLGDSYEPHGWSKHQYKSDTSTDRVQKLRAKRNVSETPPDTDTDTEVVVAKATTTARGAKPNPFPKPEWADDQVWSDFMGNRKAKKARNTATAYAGFLTDIEKHCRPAWPPGKLLAHAVAKGWAGIYEPREMQDDRTSAKQSTPFDRRSGMDKALDRRLGLDDDPGPFGRSVAGEGAGNSQISLAAPAAMRRAPF